ncbi:hypothetical protein CBX96_04010 [Shewanella sp. BC20]|uniref:hypothetical protein n=1 Tax=Shewanella sp. BC20 TaxID=2004459 RepID=UPI000D64D882|nr:hypothetical protein [Shewanella sp. BC20]PWF64937.1 hypothetical protein CBX96_04010 [Shewanella sp. BC20]
MSHPFEPFQRTISIDGHSQLKTVNGCSFNITWPQQQLSADRKTLASFLNQFGHCEVVDAPADKREWAQEFAEHFNLHRQPLVSNQHTAFCGGAL